jgi:5-methylcytosine-specific restriction protein B
MKIEEAAQILKEMYDTAPEGEKVIRVHLFGIKYADQIANIPCQEIAIRADLKPSYGTEIRKGINLARYVDIRMS